MTTATERPITFRDDPPRPKPATPPSETTPEAAPDERRSSDKPGTPGEPGEKRVCV